jgi:hypothetical protein
MTTLPDTAALSGHLGEQSAFARGNHALRMKDYSRAIENYLAAPIATEALRRMVGLNGVLARRARRREQARAAGSRVMICGWDLSEPCPRVIELAGLYESSSDVEIVGSVFGERGTADLWPGLIGITVPVKHFSVRDPAKFIELAQAFAIANPCDAIHLSKPMASNLLLGLVYRLLWDARVIVDIDADDLVGLRQPRPTSLEGYLRKRNALPGLDQLLGEDWTRLGFGLADDFDGLTVATDTLRKQFGGYVISGDPKLRRASALRLRQQSVALVKRSSSVSSEALRVMELVPEGRALHAFGVLLDINTARFDQAPPASAPRLRATVATPKTMRIVAQADAAEPSEIGEFAPQAVTEPEWTRAADFHAEPGGAPLLQMAGLPLGLWPADEAEAPSLAPLAALCRLYGRDPASELQFAPAEAEPAGVPGGLLAGESPVGLAALGIADIWYTSDATLRIRIDRAASADGESPPPMVLRCYQVDLQTSALGLAGENVVYGKEPAFADVMLADPLSPVLVVATGVSGEMMAATLLPFPSLCRGGWHHGELAALGLRGEYMSNLQAGSAALLAEFLDSRDAAPPLSVGGLAIDLQGATGAEKIFSPETLRWLRKVMGVGWQGVSKAAGAEDPAAAAYLADALAVPDEQAADAPPPRLAERAAGRTLQLPADSLPTISALVARGLPQAADAPAAVGTYVLAHPTTGKALSIVTLPAIDAELLALQPRDIPQGFPVLRSAAGAGDASAPLGTAGPIPLALSFREHVRNRPAPLLSPLAPDLAGPLLRRTLSDDERAQATVTVVLAVNAVDDALALFVESLASQTLAPALDIVAAVGSSLGDSRAALDALLARVFAGRHAVIEVAAHSRDQLLQAAATAARGRRMLIADPACVLHDPRTLETLYLVGLDDRVATASCVLLREETFKKGSEVRFHSGGFYPSHVSLLGAPHLVFTEPYTLTAFPAATYPVAGNSFRLALVNTAVWAELGGIATGAFPHHRADLDFCIRAQLAGYRHLCTAAVSASCLHDGRTEQFVDSHTLRQMPPQRWQEMLAGVTLIYDIGG